MPHPAWTISARRDMHVEHTQTPNPSVHGGSFGKRCLGGKSLTIFLDQAFLVLSSSALSKVLCSDPIRWQMSIDNVDSEELCGIHLPKELGMCKLVTISTLFVRSMSVNARRKPECVRASDGHCGSDCACLTVSHLERSIQSISPSDASRR